MKKSELKSILKPLVKECIKEALFEEGILSGIISEVVNGLSDDTPISADPPALREPMIERMKQNAFGAKQTEKLQGHKKKLMAAIGERAYNGVNLFEGTKAAPSEKSATQQARAHAGVEPSDAGVDISNLLGSVGNHWGAHMTELRKGE